MDKSGHLITGFTVGILFIVITNIWLKWFSKDIKSVVIYATVILIYCLIPDLDSKSSTIVWLFIPLSIIGMGYGYYVSNKIIMIAFFTLLVVTFVSAAWMPHRGFIHSMTFGILVSAPLLYFFNYQIALLAFVCFYSHLAADQEFLKVV